MILLLAMVSLVNCNWIKEAIEVDLFSGSRIGDIYLEDILIEPESLVGLLALGDLTLTAQVVDLDEDGVGDGLDLDGNLGSIELIYGEFKDDGRFTNYRCTVPRL